MTIEELESILTSVERKKTISEDNKLAAFFERKSRGQKQEVATKRNKTPITQQDAPKTSRHRMVFVGGAVLVVLILAVYFLL